MRHAFCLVVQDQMYRNAAQQSEDEQFKKAIEESLGAEGAAQDVTDRDIVGEALQASLDQHELQAALQASLSSGSSAKLLAVFSILLLRCAALIATALWLPQRMKLSERFSCRPAKVRLCRNTLHAFSLMNPGHPGVFSSQHAPPSRRLMKSFKQRLLCPSACQDK
jgi:hypothetical protein